MFAGGLKFKRKDPADNRSSFIAKVRFPNGYTAIVEAISGNSYDDLFGQPWHYDPKDSHRRYLQTAVDIYGNEAQHLITDDMRERFKHLINHGYEDFVAAVQALPRTEPYFSPRKK